MTLPSRFSYAFVIGTMVLPFALASSGWAPGGPPLVTDDPDTPENGNWEINATVIAAQNHQRWDLAAPDLDINYGLGEYVQLKFDANWASAFASDGRLISGFGAMDFGVK
jgi:hypothetical protein